MSRKTTTGEARTEKCDARKTGKLTPPFQYFGGKRRVAHIVWEALGDPTTYIEPFFGAGAVLLARPPTKYAREVINDKDAFVANFWRATKARPTQVAKLCDWPVNEVDLQARHRWLCDAKRKSRFLSRMRADPDYHSPKIAAWWCWGISQWFGRGWCNGQWHGVGNPKSGGEGLAGSKKPLPGRQGVHSDSRIPVLCESFRQLAHRLRRVVVVCGDWQRAIPPCVCRSSPNGTVGIFLDPPYDHSAGRDAKIYREEMPCTQNVRDFCGDAGSAKATRIVLAGLDGEYRLPGWKVVPWIRAGLGAWGKASRNRERLWLSPGCKITPAIRQAIRDNRRRIAGLGPPKATQSRKTAAQRTPNKTPSKPVRTARRRSPRRLSKTKAPRVLA